MCKINVLRACKTLCLSLKDVKSEMLFSSAIRFKLNPFIRLSMTLLHTSNESLL